MSYQTITNFNFDSQNVSFNLNGSSSQNNIQNSNNNGKSVSFMDMLNSYNSDLNKNVFGEKSFVQSSFKSEAGEVKSFDGVETFNSGSERVSDFYEKQKTESNVAYKEKTSDETSQKVDENKNGFAAEENKKNDVHSVRQDDEKNLENDENVSLSKKSDKKVSNKKSSKNSKVLSDRDFDRVNEISFNGSRNLAEKTENASKITSDEKKGLSKSLINKNNIEDFEQNNQNFDENILLAQNLENVSQNGLQKNMQKGSDSGNSESNEESDFSKMLEMSQNEKNVLSVSNNGKITVQDLRSVAQKNVDLMKNGENGNSKNDGFGAELKMSKLELSEEGVPYINMEMNQNINADVLSLNNQTVGSNGSNFQAMLNNQIQNSVPEFVKAGNIILKDNDQGQINLVLHPDDLGNVKIHLSLDGKTISANIIVSSKEALQVFKDNAETLREAFIKNGFDAAGFEVSYNNSNSSFGQNSGFENQNDGTELLAKRVYSNVDGDSVSAAENFADAAEKYSNYSVNIVA